MLNTNLDCLDSLKKNYRHYEISACLEMVNLEQDQSIGLRAEHMRKGSCVEQVLKTVMGYVENRLHIGMTLGKKIWPHVISSPARPDHYYPPSYSTASLCGYVGRLNRSDENTDDQEFISIRFAQRNFEKLSLRFAQNRAPDLFELQILDKYAQVIWKKTFIDAACELEEAISLDGKQAHKIEIIIMKPPKSGLRTHLLTLSPSYIVDWSDRDIGSCKISRQKSDKNPSQGSAISSTLDLTIFNYQRFFDLANNKSPYYKNLREGSMITLTLLLKEAGEHSNVIEKFALGTFFVTEWLSSEDNVNVRVKASDLIDFTKGRRLYGQLFEKISAQQAFLTFAQAIGLKSCMMQGKNSNMILENIALDGKAGDVIQNLCIQTFSFAYTSEDGENLIIKEMQALPSICRYPLREFRLEDFTDYSEKVAKRPNTFHCNYSLLEFEGDSEGERLLTPMYSPRITYEKMFEESFEKPEIEEENSPYFVDRFPKDLKNQYWNRPIGADQKISWQGEFPVPDRFMRLEFSDEFGYETLEYSWDYLRDDVGEIIEPRHVSWKVWLFQYDSETDVDKILSLYTVVRPKVRKLVSHIETIPGCPTEYIKPSEDVELDFDPNDAISVRNRNWQNEPYTFDVTLAEKTSLNQVVPQNFYRKGFFEFALVPYSHGVRVEVWNYSHFSQDFEIDLYGRKIIESEQKQRQTLTIPEFITEDGVIEQEVALPGTSNSYIAKLMLKNLTSYHQAILGTAELTPWSDPRITIGDRLSFESIRNYEKKEALVEGITLEYDGVLKQKISLSLVKKVNRDSRVYGGFALRDRPQYSRKPHHYPNDGIY